uniref:Retrotransposon gag domain-containing protein n=1 Tax=Brassica oleracea var. oleracea TaxID=109376 RepID=A0A0D3E8H3_BRAOL
MPTLETPNSGTGVNLSPMAPGGDTSTRENAEDARTYDVEDSESEPEPDKEVPNGATKAESPIVAYLEQMFSKRLDAMQSMVERVPGVTPPIRKSNPDSYADTPFTDEITLIEIPRNFSFPSIKVYDSTTNPDDHVTQYRQRILAIALPKESREAAMCKGFGSTLTGPALQWYINLTSRSIASFAVLSDKFVEQFASSRDLEKTSDGLYEILQHRVEPLRGYIARFNQENVAIPECSIPTAISTFKRGLLPDGDLYKELTKYQCKTMEDVLSRTGAHVKWEEDVASCAKAQQNQDRKTIRPDRIERDEKPSQRPARDSGNHNRGTYQNWPIQKGWQQVASEDESTDSFRNPCYWCDFHRDHGHKTEDCVAQNIKVNELLKKGHLREFLSEKAESHLNKETTGKPTEAASVSPPRQDRVIHVISARSEISGMSHAAAKECTWNAKHSLDAAKPKGLLLGTDDISFPAKE